MKYSGELGLGIERKKRKSRRKYKNNEKGI